VEVVNSVIAENGGPSSTTGGISLNTVTTSLLYLTIVGNLSSGADSVVCTSATVDIRNSIVSGVNAESIAPGCSATTTITHSVVDTASYVTGTNASVTAYNPAWFASPAAGDFRLSAAAPTSWATVAQWMTGDPELDLDGTPRPQSGPGYPGADEPE
jgi:hypothetical protein